jgi:ubiquinone biosynthesis protein
VFSASIDPQALPPPARLALRLARIVERRRPERLRRLTARPHPARPTYVKLGQFLATRPTSSALIARELESLQDRMPPFPKLAEAVVAIEALRPAAHEAFASFGEPVAAASIAQVHRARVREADGNVREVAVKVLRPRVADRFRRDLADYYFAARNWPSASPEARRLKPIEHRRHAGALMAIELDLRLEAAAASEMAERTATIPASACRTVDWDRTGRTS